MASMVGQDKFQGETANQGVNASATGLGVGISSFFSLPNVAGTNEVLDKVSA
jgi:hypothetical protein